MSGMLGSLAVRIASANPENQHHILLQAFHELVRSDAVALLSIHEDVLTIVACIGLSPDAMGRSFKRQDHPRLDVICNSEQAVIFPPDCKLDDPFDGLIGIDGSAAAPVHSCMGIPFFFKHRIVGVLTADALAIDAFRNLDMAQLDAFANFCAAEMTMLKRLEELESTAEKMRQISRHLVHDARGIGGGELIGESQEINRLRHEIDLVARSDFNVLITGETGVGKELVARAIHAASKRCDQPLLSINCAALPQTLIESELFGHVRGAFTGATADRAGKLGLADGATLFLDEVGELPLDVQPKLLRFLQTGEVQRVGSNKVQFVNVRLVAATNRDLVLAVDTGRFRADLFYRLNVYPIHVLPLREHMEDVPMIMGRYGDTVQKQLGLGRVRFRADTYEKVARYPWPGNVRELENLIGRAILRASFECSEKDMVVVTPDQLGIPLELPVHAGKDKQVMSGHPQPPKKILKECVEDFQRDLIRSAVESHSGNWAAAARQLGINRSNLHKLALRLGLKNR